MTSNLSEKVYRVCDPTLTGNELRNVSCALLAGEISGKGRFVQEFEKAFTEIIGAKYGVAMANGSISLLAALQAIGIGEGDEIICPTFTMAAPAIAANMLGANCRWVDCLKNGNINPDLIEEKISSNTKAILVVHVYGIPCEMDEIMRIAERHGIPVIEDAAEAHGAKYKNRFVGTIGAIGCFSFYANKIITCGEGGMCVTNDEKIAEKLRSLREYSMDTWYTHERNSLNYRLPNLSAAIGLAQCERFTELVFSRNLVASLYDSLLKDVPGIKIRERPLGSVNWMYGILSDKRDDLIRGLAETGIESRPFFVPMHKQPFNDDWDTKTSYPVAEYLSEKGLYLPTSSHLRPDEIQYISQNVIRCANV